MYIQNRKPTPKDIMPAIVPYILQLKAQCYMKPTFFSALYAFK